LLGGLAGTVAHSRPVPAAADLRAPDDAAARPFAGIIAAASRRHGVDEALVHSIVFVESSYDPEAVSSQGALGLMQLMPVTAERYGVRDALDPAQNVDGGVRFLRDLLDLFEGDIELTIAAYNAGANAVIRAGYRIPGNTETLAFVPRVLGYYEGRRAVAETRSPLATAELAQTMVARNVTPHPPATDPARDLLRDRGSPPPEREERPVGIVSARRSSRWRLGRVRFSGAASSLFSALPDARDVKESRKAGKVRRTARVESARPATRRSGPAKRESE
jgi:hypothetical protein